MPDAAVLDAPVAAIPAATPPPAPVAPVPAVAAPAVEAKPIDPAPPVVPAVPEKYELTLPKDSTLDPSVIERTAATARALGLSNDAAQKALDLVNAEVVARDAAAAEAEKPGGERWTARVQEYEAAARADKEIGGTPEKFQANLDLAKRTLAAHGDPELVTYLEESGLGSHPAVIRFAARIGRAMGESAVTLPTVAGTSAQKTVGELLYTHPTSPK